MKKERRKLGLFSCDVSPFHVWWIFVTSMDAFV